MPLRIPCANYPCQRNADKPGGLCAECQRLADAQKANAWKWAGWSRQSERWNIQGKKPRGGEGKD